MIIDRKECIVATVTAVVTILLVLTVSKYFVFMALLYSVYFVIKKNNIDEVDKIIQIQNDEKENSLYIAKNRVSLLMEKNSCLVAFFDDNLNIKFANDSFMRAFDVSFEKNESIFLVLEKGILNREKFKERIKKIDFYEIGNVGNFEVLHKNGEAYRVFFYSKNVTERLVVLENCSETYKYSSIFDLIFENIDEAAALIDKEMRIIKYNDNYKDFFMFNEGIDIYPKIELTYKMSENKVLFWEKIIEKALKGEKVNIENKYYSDFSDKSCDILVNAAPVENPAGKSENVLLIIKDISELRSKERDIFKLRQDIGKITNLKNEFIDKINSSLRTPLNNIISGLDLIENNKRENDMIGIIKESGNTLISILEDMSEYSNLESGKITLDLQQVKLVDIISECIEKYKNIAERKELIFEFKVQNINDKEVYADSVKIVQLLSNLLSNAIKFTFEGKITVNLEELQNGGDKTKYKITISDTGVGMENEQLNSIHKRINGVDKEESSYGLGMYLISKISKLMGMEVFFKSQKNKGTDVILEFTLNNVIEKIKQNDTILRESIESGNKKILIVEDNNMNQIVMAKILKIFKIDSEIAENGQEAVNKIENINFDAILMDIQMPVMNGYEATIKIREYEKLNNKKRIPIIALTAYAMQSDREKCLEAGMDEYLSKPVIKEELFKVLEKFL